MVRTNDRRGLKIDVKIGINSVVSEIVFLEHRVFQLITTFLDILANGVSTFRRFTAFATYINFGIVYLECVNVVVVFLYLV